MVSQRAKVVSEFIGTYMLVLAVGCNVITGSPVFGVTSIACTLMVCIYALGGISGAHFNPAVSFALGIAKKMEWNDVGIYICVQLVAGICAGLSYGATLWHVFNLDPPAGALWWQAGLAELIYTFMLCFVVLNVACCKKNSGNEYYGLAIGFVVIAGGYGAGHISGGCFNPAVAWGIDLSSAGIGFGWCFVYTIFELLGAALAATLFMSIRPEERSEFLEAPSEYSVPAKLLSEFLGTFMLVLTVGLNVLGNSPAPVWSIAASLMCMIYALGSVSGAHFNPAVTVAILVTGRDLISQDLSIKYIVAQVGGGICAALTYTAMEGGRTFPLGPGKGYGWAEVGIAEIIFTFLLCFVVLCVATIRQPISEYFGLAIGSCVTAGGCAIGAVSGGSLNPAVSVGISSAHVLGGGGYINCVGYVLAEVLGGIIAGVIFRQTHPGEFFVKATSYQDYEAPVPIVPVVPVLPAPRPVPMEPMPAPAPAPAPRPRPVPYEQPVVIEPAAPPAPKGFKFSGLRLAADIGDKKMDPYIAFDYGGKKLRSNTVRNGGRNCEWQDVIDGPIMLGEQMTLTVADFDRGKVHEPIGMTQPFVVERQDWALKPGGAAVDMELFKDGQKTGKLTLTLAVY